MGKRKDIFKTCNWECSNLDESTHKMLFQVTKTKQNNSKNTIRKSKKNRIKQGKIQKITNSFKDLKERIPDTKTLKKNISQISLEKIVNKSKSFPLIGNTMKEERLIENTPKHGGKNIAQKSKKKAKLLKTKIKFGESSKKIVSGKIVDELHKKTKMKNGKQFDKQFPQESSQLLGPGFNTVKGKRKPRQELSLREKMLDRLKAARFRFLNEQIYSTEGKDAQKLFREDPEAFKAYHAGYRQQVARWPLNPLDVMIKSIKKMSKDFVVADFGCGDAILAKSVEQKVHSFDLVAANDMVTACDMAHVPIPNSSVDVIVFCLSLMGTNLKEYFCEANRVLKTGGLLKIAEVESRFEKVDDFIEGIQHFGFKKSWKDLSHNLFYFIDFKKVGEVKKTKKSLPTLSLNPCLYKRR